jgi:hypothetical protein
MKKENDIRGLSLENVAKVAKKKVKDPFDHYG